MAIRIGKDSRLAKMHSPAVAVMVPRNDAVRPI